MIVSQDYSKENEIYPVNNLLCANKYKTEKIK